MNKTKDISEEEFKTELETKGIRPYFFGYYYVTDHLLINANNGGRTFREKLAYLIKQQEKEIQKITSMKIK
jgi:hypothetical protein